MSIGHVDPQELKHHLSVISDHTLSEKERKKSELWLALRQKLPEGYIALPEPTPRKRKTPEGATKLTVPQRDPELDKIPAWGKLETVLASDVKQEAIRWLWDKRIPQGKITVLGGDMGLGKSLFATYLMSIVTTGGRWPDGRGKAELGSAIYMQGEDDPHDTIVPRLAKAGCDLKRVHLTTTVRQRDGSLQPFMIGRDLAPLTDFLTRVKDVRLIVLDPVSDYLFGVDEHKDSEVRKALNPLRDVARKFKAAVILVRHLNKSGGIKALYRFSGSGGFVGVGRASMLLCEHPFDDGRRLLLPAKANLAGKIEGLSFRIEDTCLVWDEEPLEWTADDALKLIQEEKYDDDKPRRGPNPEARKRAMALILELLAKGPRGDLRKNCREQNIAAVTYYRALEKLLKDGRIERAPSDNGEEVYRLAPGKEAQPSLPLGDRRPGVNGHSAKAVKS